MTTAEEPPRNPALAWRTVRLIALTAFCFYLLYLLRGVLPVFVVSFLLAYVLSPLVDRLEKRGWRRGWCVALVYLGFLAPFAILVLVLLPLLVGELGDLAGLIARLPGRIALLWEAQMRQRSVWTPLIEQALSYVQTHGDRLAASLGKWLTTLLRALRGSLALAFSFLLTPIITYYFIRDMAAVRRLVRETLPRRYRAEVVEAVREVERMLGRYVRAQFVISLLIAVSASLILGTWQLVFHSRYALLLGVLGGLLSVIPVIGALTLWIITALVTYLTAASPLWATVAAVGSLVALNQLFDNLITPRLMGEAVGVHPLLIIFALIVGGHLLGLAGMLIAVPAAATAQIAFRHFVARSSDSGAPQASDDC